MQQMYSKVELVRHAAVALGTIYFLHSGHKGTIGNWQRPDTSNITNQKLRSKLQALMHDPDVCQGNATFVAALLSSILDVS